MLPALGGTMLRIIRASVVLPLPELADDGEDLGLVGGDREAYAVHCADAAAVPSSPPLL